MLLYADEDFSFPAVEELRRLGHDVLTAQEDGHRATPDPAILARAHALGRVVLTHNRRHYIRLHHSGVDHSGIVSATQDPDHPPWQRGSIQLSLVSRQADGICASTDRRNGVTRDNKPVLPLLCRRMGSD